MRQDNKKPFKERILEASRSNRSKIVLAIDVHGGTVDEVAHQAMDLVEKTRKSICSVKFGRQTVLSLGPEKSFDLLQKIGGYGLTRIIDDKLNDIDETNGAITRIYQQLGFDALTVNPFAGWKGGLDTTFRFAHEHFMGVIALVYMSHPGAAEGYGQRVLRSSSGEPRPQFEVFAEKAVEWNADGAVVGATRPNIVRRVKEILDYRVPIFSPGVGAQGGEISRALRAGTDYFIVGRSIARAENPGAVAKELARISVPDN